MIKIEKFQINTAYEGIFEKTLGLSLQESYISTMQGHRMLAKVVPTFLNIWCHMPARELYIDHAGPPHVGESSANISQYMVSYEAKEALSLLSIDDEANPETRSQAFHVRQRNIIYIVHVSNLVRLKCGATLTMKELSQFYDIKNPGEEARREVLMLDDE
uniref:Uncharacterized protein n=1 Tax=Timema poppense TaxID=170557 RepID=A0A7R9HA45_TIMPO|nr:unnamed protein product [Timema poppensis]